MRPIRAPASFVPWPPHFTERVMLNLLRSLIPNSYARALVLKALRWAGAAAAGALIPWLISHGVSAADASSIAAALAALILGGGSALFSALDARSVDTEVKAATAATTATVAGAIQSGAATPAYLVSQAHAALAGDSVDHEALAQTLAILRAGQA
jgi:hypothetical protein